MIVEYKVDLQHPTNYEELSEGEDIVINAQYSSEEIGSREFLSFPHGLLVKNKAKNEAVFIDNYSFNVVKVTGIDIDKLEWCLPYSLAGVKADENGLMVKLKDGKILRIVVFSDNDKKKDKYRFAFVGNFLIPLYRADFSKKKLEKIKDKIFIFENLPSRGERRNAKKKLLDFLNSRDNSQVIYAYGNSTSEPIDKVLVPGPVVFKEPRKFSNLSLDNVKEGKDAFRRLIRRAFSVFNLNSPYNDRSTKEVRYVSIYTQKFLQEGIKDLCSKTKGRS